MTLTNLTYRLCGSVGLPKRASVGRLVAGMLSLVLLGANTGLAQVGSSAPVRLTPNTEVRTTQYNSEWVESSSPLPGGGIVTTTHFPSTGQTLTAIREPAPLLSSAPQVGTSGLAPIPTGNGGYLVPTVSYVPMNSAAVPAYAQMSYTAAAPNVAQYGTCATCQTMLTQPTAYQPSMVPMAYANQQPVLPPTAGGVYAPIQSQYGVQAAPGFYAQPQAPAASGGLFSGSGQSGYRPLVSRSLPAGTYIGQGWLGQPKAYVNDQPFRNLMRYMIVP